MAQTLKKNSAIKPEKSLFKRIFLALSVLIIGIVVWVTISTITSTVDSKKNLNTVGEKVAQAREQVGTTFDESRTHEINFLIETGIIQNAEPIYSSKVDACFVASSDAGWVATDYYQTCYLRYIDMFTTTENFEFLRSKLEAQPQRVGEIVGVTKDSYIDAVTCDSGGAYTLGDTIFMTLDLSVPDYSSSCPPTNQIYGDRVVMYARDNKSTFASKAIRSFNTSDIDFTKSYFYLINDRAYSTESLGCKQPKNIFCEQPVDKPITAF